MLTSPEISLGTNLGLILFHVRNACSLFTLLESFRLFSVICQLILSFRKKDLTVISSPQPCRISSSRRKILNYSFSVKQSTLYLHPLLKLLYYFTLNNSFAAPCWLQVGDDDWQHLMWCDLHLMCSVQAFIEVDKISDNETLCFNLFKYKIWKVIKQPEQSLTKHR